MPEEEEKEVEEKEESEDSEEEALQCVECESLYADTPDTRRIVNRLGEFICPRCMLDHEQEARGRKPKDKKAPPEAPAAPPAPPAQAPPPKKR